jgi:hypothetical protein
MAVEGYGVVLGLDVVFAVLFVARGVMGGVMGGVVGGGGGLMRHG